MWIARRRRWLERSPLIGLAVAAGLMAAAVVLKLLLPNLPTLASFMPAVIIGAFLGGRGVGLVALVLGTVASAYFVFNPPPPSTFATQTVSVLVFVMVGGTILFIIHLLDEAIRRLEREQAQLRLERAKLGLSLKAGRAATWNITQSKMQWDRTFYELVGLPYSDSPPTESEFFAMVHDDDRAKMTEARQQMARGLEPKPSDEYRLRRADGSWIWLINHRVQIDAENYVGLTIDITERKLAEEKIHFLFRELVHRTRNQFAVINSIAREVYKQSGSITEFENLFRHRMVGLARSQEAVGNAQDNPLSAIVAAQADIFGLSSRIDIKGVPVRVSETGAQYLSIALYELITNSIKYGAFTAGDARISVNWTVSGDTLEILWSENCSTTNTSSQPFAGTGFGARVLKDLTAQALDGQSEYEVRDDGVRWSLTVPLGRHFQHCAGA